MHQALAPARCMRLPPLTWLVLLTLVLSACSSAPKAPAGPRSGASAPSRTDSPPPASAPAYTRSGKGGYYLDDGPMDIGNINLDAIPDAQPAVEPLHRFANRPYNIFGNDYTPQQSLDDPFEQSGVGSWYGRKFHGQRTSSGEIYDMFAMTAAHPTLPIPSYARVTNPRNGRSVIVRVNDRGPFLHSRVIDLSYAAAHRLGYVQQGSAEVRVEKLTPMLVARLRDGRPLAVASVSPPAASPTPVAASQATAVAVPAASAAPAVPIAPAVSSSPALPPITAPSPSPPESRPDPATLLSAAATETPISAWSAGEGGFFLQLGAFSVEDNARAFLSRMSLEFSTHLPNLRLVRREPHIRLVAGPYPSREEALVASRRLRDMASIAAVVIAP